ncbi:MAG TPA: hypothetical protein VGM60_06895 [Pseudonocardia sp.]|uniref:hypothetical protein n=1 Tax=Pseudonocardia sp. TaxID=60912 RepID=UPI002F401626
MTETMTSPKLTISIPTQAMLRGFAAIRIFFGLDWLSNALAKLIDKMNYDGGFITFSLVNRGVANGILHQGVMSTKIAPLRWFYGEVVLPHFGFFGWLLTVAELAIAIGLLFGIFSRLAATGGLLLLAPIWLMLFTTDQYLWTYPLDVLPLVLLAVVPTGRYLGLDSRISARLGRHRWPLG